MQRNIFLTFYDVNRNQCWLI